MPRFAFAKRGLSKISELQQNRVFGHGLGVERVGYENVLSSSAPRLHGGDGRQAQRKLLAPPWVLKRLFKKSKNSVMFWAIRFSRKTLWRGHMCFPEIFLSENPVKLAEHFSGIYLFTNLLSGVVLWSRLAIPEVATELLVIAMQAGGGRRKKKQCLPLPPPHVQSGQRWCYSVPLFFEYFRRWGFGSMRGWICSTPFFPHICLRTLVFRHLGNLGQKRDVPNLHIQPPTDIFAAFWIPSFLEIRVAS